MGTYYTNGASRADIIREVTETQTNKEGTTWKTLAKYCSGNDMWAVQEIARADGETQRYIALFILKPSRDGWGYKPVDESMGPYQHSCPLKFLDMVPEPKRSEGYHDWRQGVRDYHARRNQKLSVGQVITLTNKREYRVTRLVKGKIMATDIQGGGSYRIPRNMLTLAKPEGSNV